MLAAPLTSPPLDNNQYNTLSAGWKDFLASNSHPSGPILPIQPPTYDSRGRQINFEETVRQRQERLTFLRRQESARRHAHISSIAFASSSSSSTSSTRRRNTPAERVSAATTIQRAFRAHISRQKALDGIRSVQAELNRVHKAFPISSNSADRSNSLEYVTFSPRLEKEREQRVHARLLRLQGTLQSIFVTYQRAISSYTMSTSLSRGKKEISKRASYNVGTASQRVMEGAKVLSRALIKDIEIMQHITLERCVRDLRDAHRAVLNAIDEEIPGAYQTSRKLSNSHVDPRAANVRRVKSLPTVLYSTSSSSGSESGKRSSSVIVKRRRSSLPPSLEVIIEVEEPQS